MQVKDIIKIISNNIEEEKTKIKERKNNINSDYILAKLDFTCIENMEDYVKTLENILPKLEDLQNRIIERNRK